ncbi:hypothetical protein LTR53_014478 [Teratosphaeriaceae sp. CCFEE 6253]|nr:hypothetical protein LTR53_014478 [Teratosphaeriaceae sp. CCFEE 6253]
MAGAAGVVSPPRRRNPTIALTAPTGSTSNADVGPASKLSGSLNDGSMRVVRRYRTGNPDIPVSDRSHLEREDTTAYAQSPIELPGAA